MINSKCIQNLNCPITFSDEKHQIIDLGMMPLVNNLCDTKEESLNCDKYPLAVDLYPRSGLFMLDHTIDPKVLYSHYLYKSGVSQPYIDHCYEMYGFLNSYLNLQPNIDYILDIGGNDGTLLKTFLKKQPGLNVLNIDASQNLTELSNKNGVTALNMFWSEQTAHNVVNKFMPNRNIRFKLIVSTNVFQHTYDIVSFVAGIKIALDKRGIWCLEFPYWNKTVETKQYDQIYHEHLYYYNITAIKELLDKYDLEIIKAVEYPIHGGTMRLLISHKNSWNPCFGVQVKLIEESNKNIEFYQNWGLEIKKHIKKCDESLNIIHPSDIIGFGAAAKGCIFLNSINSRLKYVIDDTDLKQGKFIPGVGTEIVSRKILKEKNYEFILILAHNFTDYIVKSLRNDGYNGMFIVCFPEFKIIM